MDGGNIKPCAFEDGNCLTCPMCGHPFMHQQRVVVAMHQSEPVEAIVRDHIVEVTPSTTREIMDGHFDEVNIYFHVRGLP